jgi:uncharacterized damage-inducible protein DinB
MKAFLNELYDYNYYCNKKLIEACTGLDRVPEGIHRLFSHILNAHHNWNARIMDVEPQFGPWQLHEVPAWADLHYDNQRNSFEIITNADPLGRRVNYENSEGRVFSNTLQDILFHIINHSTHHRAQITAALRAEGLEPPSLDYIVYKR